MLLLLFRASKAVSKKEAWAAKLPARSATFRKLRVQLEPVETPPSVGAQDLAPGFCVSKGANMETFIISFAGLFSLSS